MNYIISELLLRVGHQENWPAVRTINPGWFDHLLHLWKLIALPLKMLMKPGWPASSCKFSLNHIKHVQLQQVLTGYSPYWQPCVPYHATSVLIVFTLYCTWPDWYVNCEHKGKFWYICDWNCWSVLLCVAFLTIFCPCVFPARHCHSPQSICGHLALVNRFIPLVLSLRFMMCCVTEGNIIMIYALNFR